MKLENQVASLELSKKLKELGVKQESFFWWTTFGEEWILKNHNHDYRTVPEGFDCISAYTVAELGEMLPDERADEHQDIPYNLTVIKFGDEGYHVSYQDLDRGRIGEGFEDRNEANARALMLVYLLEEKLIATPNDTV